MEYLGKCTWALNFLLICAGLGFLFLGIGILIDAIFK